MDQAVAAGVLAAEVDLAADLLRDRPDPPGDVKRGLELLERAAGRGNPDAHRRLFLAYALGTPGGPPGDSNKAEAHLRQAVDLGSPRAMVDLARELKSPKLLKLAPDVTRAYALFDRAAQTEYPPALVGAAAALAAGRGAPRDHFLARERLGRAVRAGDREADYLQGSWHFLGDVYPQGDAEALACFKRAADKGQPNGCVMAGYMYSQGRGFKVRPRWENVTMYHADWFIALHYLTRAEQIGLYGDEDKKKYAHNIIAGFRRGLAGIEEGFYLDHADVGVFTAKVPFGFATFYTASKRIAADWRNIYPDTFSYFCEMARIDPTTFKNLVQLEDNRPKD